LSEKAIVRQNKNFETGFWIVDPEKAEAQDYYLVHGLHEVTPYGMLLISLAACTAQVVLIYAQHHGMKLDEVEFHMTYDRVYEDDCEGCEKIDRYEEKVGEQITFIGDLSDEDRRKLFQIAHHCPIEKILKHGIEIHSELNRTESESHGL